jgi:hypothetical protein
MTGETVRPLAVLSVLREGEPPPYVRLDAGRLHIHKGEAEWTVKVLDEPATPSAPLLAVETPVP